MAKIGNHWYLSWTGAPVTGVRRRQVDCVELVGGPASLALFEQLDLASPSRTTDFRYLITLMSRTRAGWLGTGAHPPFH